MSKREKKSLRLALSVFALIIGTVLGALFLHNCEAGNAAFEIAGLFLTPLVPIALLWIIKKIKVAVVAAGIFFVVVVLTQIIYLSWVHKVP